MAVKKRQTEAETLEMYRVSLENVTNQPEISKMMTELGYDEAIITEGKALLTETRKIYDANKIEHDEASEAYQNFVQAKENLYETYSLHRKKAKVVFRNDKETMDRLEIYRAISKSYVKWLESIKKFYSVALTDTELRTKLARLKVTKEDLKAAQILVEGVEESRAAYLKEKGESQDATKNKDAAFSKMDDWMSEFYAVAKIALEDHPQLLESLGKHVKS